MICFNVIDTTIVSRFILVNIMMTNPQNGENYENNKGNFPCGVFVVKV